MRKPWFIVEILGSRRRHLYVHARQTRPAAALHLDDISAEIAKDLGGDRPNQCPGEVQNPHPREGSRGVIGNWRFSPALGLEVRARPQGSEPGGLDTLGTS